MVASPAALLAVALAAGVVALGGLVRLAAAILVPDPLRALAYTDVLHNMANLPFPTLHWPYLRFPFDYHPLIGWPSGVIAAAVRDPVLITLVWTVVLAAVAGMVAALLLRLAPPGRVIAFWSLSPQLLLFGSLNFDVLPVAGVVGAVVALHAGRPLVAGGALGLGAAAKLFPIAALPPLLLALRRRPRAALAALAGAAVVLLVVDGPAILAPYSLLSTAHNPYRYTGNIDTVWTVVRILLDPVTTQDVVEAVVRLASGAGLALSYGWWVLRPAWRGADPVPLFWRAIVLILLWSQLYSPQYSLWLLPVFALAVPRRGPFVLLTLGDLLTWACVFLIAGGAGGHATVAGLLAGVLLRHAALVVLFRQLPMERAAAA